MSTSQKTTENKQKLQINITSDNICQNVDEKKLSQIDTSNLNVLISWHPFELDHDLPRDGSLVKLDHYKQKLGETPVKQMLPQMTKTDQEEGINFSYAGKIGSTFDSHRLPYYVKQQNDIENKQNDSITILFRYYFEEEQDSSDHQVLIRAAKQIGFNGNRIKEFLRSNQYVKEVQQEINQSQWQGISDVPHCRINDRK